LRRIQRDGLCARDRKSPSEHKSGAKGRIVIWNSIPIMTAIDLLIMAVTIYAVWRCLLIRPNKPPSAPQVGLRLIDLGLLVVCLFFLLIWCPCTSCLRLRRRKKQWSLWVLSIAISAGWSFCSR
jgi:hypothetical protein